MSNGEEVVSPGIGGGTGEHGEVTHFLQTPLLPDHLLQVSEASSCGRVQQLCRSGAQPQARQAEVGGAELGIEHGGRRHPYTGTDLLSSSAIGPAIQVRDNDNIKL